MNLPQPVVPLGFFGLAMENVAPFRSGLTTPVDDAGVREGGLVARVWDGPIDAAGVRIEPSGSGGVLRVGDEIFFDAEFIVHNDSDRPLTRLVLVAYQHADFRAASAISQPVQVNGLIALDRVVRLIQPTHRMTYEAAFRESGEAFVGASRASHLVAFAEDELPTLDPLSFPFLQGLLPYGFLIDGGRTIDPGESGRVTIAFTFPRASEHARNLSSFTWNAVLMSAPDVRVVQAPSENHARGWSAVLDRAELLQSDRIVAIGSGVRAVPPGAACATFEGLRDVRIAGLDASDPVYAGLVTGEQVGAPVFDGCEGESP